MVSDDELARMSSLREKVWGMRSLDDVPPPADIADMQRVCAKMRREEQAMIVAQKRLDGHNGPTYAAILRAKYRR